MILITGASQGIGFECAATLLARTPSEVMITARAWAHLTHARDSLPVAVRNRLKLRTCDQADAADVYALASLVTAEESPLEAAILGVGVNPMYTEGPRRLHTLSPETIEATIRTNCTHTLVLSAAILERFRRQRSGVLLWIGSLAGRVGLPGAGLYCATKSFLSGMAHTASHEYASRGVRVHVVHPSLVRTPRTGGVVDRFGARHGVAVEEPRAVAERIVGLLLMGMSAPVEVDL